MGNLIAIAANQGMTPANLSFAKLRPKLAVRRNKNQANQEHAQLDCQAAYTKAIRLALPPAAVVLIEIDCSSTSQSAR